MQSPSIINEIYSSDFDSGWISWAETSRIFGEDSPASEFQTYGGFLTSNYRELVRLFIPSHEHVNAELVSLDLFYKQLETLSCDLVTIHNKKNMQISN
jgi:hypothetical protein